jgi:PTS system nitrogen regulatory IIA component
MKIVELIQRGAIVPQLTKTSKAEIIKELAERLVQQSPRLDREIVTRVLLEREELASTAIGEGVAIPHGKLGTLDRIVACLGRAPGGVNFDSMDGEPTHLFFVLVAPEASTGAHLKALARISRLFKDANFRRRLLEAETAAQMYDILVEEDAKY